MKKILAVALVLCMAVSLAACGGTTSQSAQSTQNTQQADAVAAADTFIIGCPQPPDRHQRTARRMRPERCEARRKAVQ